MKRISLFWRRGLWSIISLGLLLFLVAGVGILYLETQLPDVDSLKNVQLQVPLRIYTADSELMAEYGEKRRIPVTLEQIPKPLIQAVLATEDQRFYEHPGVDILGLLRAAVQLIRTGTKSQGGSTITMQVARNFFLDSRKTYIRKLNEILLAINIDRKLSKEKILELYFNKIYLGNRAYGVAAAADVYYGKTLSDLSLAQMAMIAGLPKAPSKINPITNPGLAFKRRNHVLERMLEEDYISQQQYQQAIKEPLTAYYHGRTITVHAPYVSEMIRQGLVDKLGKTAYTDGFQVYTTIDSRLQLAAQQALRKALLAYGIRHGYRGPEGNLGTPDNTKFSDWLTLLKAKTTIAGLQAAAVIEVDYRSVQALTADGKIITIHWPGLVWARPGLQNGYVGRKPQQASDILKPGDVIRISQTQQKQWQLNQVPVVEGAIVALDPNQGEIKALVGGFSFEKSKFNRITQALRQPGSSFKPFIYAAALTKGYTLASVINDAPIVRNDPSQENLWRPQNDTREFYGPTRLRVGLIRSRNLVSIRLLEAIGIPYTLNYLQNLGFDASSLPNTLSLALGSLSITPLQLATAYTIFANGGYKVEPFLIDHINNAAGKTILKTDPKVACDNCTNEKIAPRVMDPQVAYLMTLGMRDVIQHGTGRDARVLKRHDLAGKTGTTNDQRDGWFAGFNKNIVAVTWVGFDQPQSLYEYGATAALPMWVDFMRIALQNQAEAAMQQPDGLVSVRIDPKTGLLASPGQTDSIFETFRENYVPKHQTAQSQVEPYQAQSAGGDNEGMEHIF